MTDDKRERVAKAIYEMVVTKGIEFPNLARANAYNIADAAIAAMEEEPEMSMIEKMAKAHSDFINDQTTEEENYIEIYPSWLTNEAMKAALAVMLKDADDRIFNNRQFGHAKLLTFDNSRQIILATTGISYHEYNEIVEVSND